MCFSQNEEQKVSEELTLCLCLSACYWDLNSRSCTCWAGALPTAPHLQFF
jgi:hypothetical protein